MTDSPASPNGHHGELGAFKRPAPHPAPSLAAQMAEADAQAQAQHQAAAAQALLADLSAMLGGDPAAFMRLIDHLFGPVIANAVAAGVQVGIQRAGEAERERMQAEQAQAAKDMAAAHPLLAAHTGNVHMAAQAAMTGMPPGTPG